MAKITLASLMRHNGIKIVLLAGLVGLVGLLTKEQPEGRYQGALADSKLDLIREVYAGLAPEFALTIRGDRVRPNDTFQAVETSQRTLDMDFRQLKTARPPATPAAYRGTECRSHYTERICPVPGQCPPPVQDAQDAMSAVSALGPCLAWRRGQLTTPYVVREIPGLEIAKTPEELHQWDVDGQWNDPLWIPDNAATARYRFFSPEEMVQCLAGKRVLIMGDSLLRQLFTRLIQFARRIPASVEQAHTDVSVYVMYKDGSDMWDLPRSEDRSQYESSDSIFQIYFDWVGNVDITHYETLLQNIVNLQADHVILGFNYWYDKKDDFLPLPNTIEAFWHSTGWNGTMSYFAAPPIFPEHETWVLAGRNGIMRNFARHKSLKEHRRFHTIPVDKMAEAADRTHWPQRCCAHWPQGENVCYIDAHWSAGFLAHYPTAVTPGLNGIKAPPGYDCRDLFNLGILQNWLNTICD